MKFVIFGSLKNPPLLKEAFLYLAISLGRSMLYIFFSPPKNLEQVILKIAKLFELGQGYCNWMNFSPFTPQVNLNSLSYFKQLPTHVHSGKDRISLIFYLEMTTIFFFIINTHCSLRRFTLLRRFYTLL